MTIEFTSEEITADSELAIAMDTGVAFGDVTINGTITWPDGTTTQSSPSGGGGGGAGTLNVLDYGIPSNADPAFEDALSSADPGDTLLLKAATFEFTDSHVINKPVNIKVTGAEIQDNRSSVGSTGEPLFKFAGGGVQNTHSLQAEFPRGASMIEVESAGATTFSSGDVVFIESSNKSQLAVVDSVADATNAELTLEDSLRYTFPSGASAYAVDLMDYVEFSGGNVTSAHADGTLVGFEYCQSPRVDDVDADIYGEHAVSFINSRNPGVKDSVAHGGSSGAFYAEKCTDTLFQNVTAQGCDRGISLSQGCVGVTILNPHIYNTNGDGISVTGTDTVADVTIVGGEVFTTTTANSACISLNGPTVNASIYGTDLVSNIHALRLNENVDAQGISVELDPDAGNGTVMIHTVTGAQNINIEGRVTIDDYKPFTSIVNVNDNAENIDLDLDIDITGYSAASDEEPFIELLDSTTEVTIRGRVDSTSDFSTSAIKVNGASSITSNVDISTDITNHGGSGVELGGTTGYESIKIHNSYMETTGHCIFTNTADSTGTANNIWVRDCDLTSSGDTEIAFEHGAEDTVYLIFNSGSSSTTGVTNLVEQTSAAPLAQHDNASHSETYATETYVDNSTTSGSSDAHPNVINVSNQGFPGDQTGGDLAQYIADTISAGGSYVFILPGGDYDWLRPIRMTGGTGTHDVDQPSHFAIIGREEATLHADMPTDSQRIFFRFGNSSNPLPHAELHNIHFDVGTQSNSRDAGIMRAYISDKAHFENLSLSARQRLQSDGTTNGDRFCMKVDCVEQDALAVMRDITFANGDVFQGSSFSVGHAIPMASEPSHVGTNVWENCYVEGFIDNGFYLRDGTGRNVVRNCIAVNNSAGQFRLGRNDRAEGITAIQDGGEDYNSTNLWIQELRDEADDNYTPGDEDDSPCVVTDFELIKTAGSTSDVIRINDNLPQTTLRGGYVRNQTDAWIVDATANSGDLKIEDLTVDDHATGNTREASFNLDMDNAALDNVTLRAHPPDTENGRSVLRTDGRNIMVRNGQYDTTYYPLIEAYGATDLTFVDNRISSSASSPYILRVHPTSVPYISFRYNDFTDFGGGLNATQSEMDAYHIIGNRGLSNQAQNMVWTDEGDGLEIQVNGSDAQGIFNLKTQ